VSHGRVVKGIRFQGLRDAGDPAERAICYQEQGADELVVLDVSATTEDRDHAVEVIQRIRENLMVPLTVGGGVRSAEDAERLLEAGADKVAINTAAVMQPTLLSELSRRFGAQCTVLAVDARATENSWEVMVRSGSTSSGDSVLRWVHEATERGAGEILLTSWDRDGTRNGYDLALLRQVSSVVSVPVIASGGASSVEHLRQAFVAGADAVLAASIFHENDTTVDELKKQLSASGIEVRL
jgi:imidazoleglycerol phosphate synthase cyclase subunit